MSGDELFRRHGEHLEAGGRHSQFVDYVLAEHPDHARNLWLDYLPRMPEGKRSFGEFVRLIRTGRIDRSWPYARHVLHELRFEFFARLPEWSELAG